MSAGRAGESVTTVVCPLCLTVGPSLVEMAQPKTADWQCPRCQHQWSLQRLATVAAYDAYVAARAPA